MVLGTNNVLEHCGPPERSRVVQRETLAGISASWEDVCFPLVLKWAESSFAELRLQHLSEFLGLKTERKPYEPL